METFWGRQVSADIPESFSHAPEAPNTVSLVSGRSGVVMELSLVVLERSSDHPVGHGRAYVRDEAARRGVTPIESDGSTLLVSDDVLAEEWTPFHQRQWLIGGHDQVAVLTCWVPHDEQGTPPVDAALQGADAMARSLKFLQRFSFFAEGGVQSKTRLKPGPAPTVRPLTADEQSELDRHAAAGEALLDRYAPDADAGVFDRLDIALAAWMADRSFSRPDANLPLTALFGTLLNAFFESDWQLVIDGHGPTFAVRHAARGVTVLPGRLITKWLRERSMPSFARTRNVFERIIAGDDAVGVAEDSSA